MRIALVSEHADPLAALGGVDAGGQNVHVAALARGLTKLGHEVVVHTRRSRLGDVGPLRCRDGYVVDHVPAGPPTEVPKDELLPYMGDFGDVLRARWRERPVDVVHAHFWMSGLAALRATAGTGTPVVQTFHALGSVKRREQGHDDTSPPSRVEHERRLCREVSHVVATCREELTELARLGLRPERATVIPCGVDVASFRPAQGQREPGPPRVLIIGRLVARKGVADALTALAGLPGVEVLIAGGPSPGLLGADPEARRLRRLAERLGMSDRVRFLGGVPRDDVPALVRSSDVVVAVPWYEPFGIVPLEAMASGVPVVGSAVGGLLDTVVPGVTGELVPPHDPELLAAVLGDLLEDPARRAAYGEAGRRRAVDLYDWQAVAERTEAVLRAVAGSVPMRMEATR
jgi:glycosyltransferase involved in cell wall biosynthesis